MRDNTKGVALTEVTYFTLLSLYTPKHGYSIMQFIKEETKGRVTLGAGTMYGAINTLETKGLICLGSQDNLNKKIYQITEQGKEVVDNEILRLKQIYDFGITITKKEVSDE